MGTRSNKVNFTNFLGFVLGLGAFIHIQLIGYISVSEVLLLGFGLIFLILHYRQRPEREALILLGLGLLWFASALVSDLVARTPGPEMIKGLGKVVSISVTAYSFYVILKHSPKAASWISLGLALSSLIGAFYGKVGPWNDRFAGSTFADMNWESTYVYIFMYSLLAFCCFVWERSPAACLSSLLGGGTLSIILGSRNIGASIVLGGFLSWMLMRGSRQAPPRRVSRGKVGIILSAAAALVLVIAGLYSYAARTGLLGEKAQYKYQLQSAGTYGLLLTARPEFLGGILAVYDSPFLGYGSWARDKHGYLEEAIHLVGLDSWGNPEGTVLFSDRIPAHSHLLEAWTEHGALASLFWFYALLLIIRGFRSPLASGPFPLPLLCVQFCLLGWNILFSPIGSRTALGFVLALLLLTCEFPTPRESEARSHAAGAGNRQRQIRHPK